MKSQQSISHASPVAAAKKKNSPRPGAAARQETARLAHEAVCGPAREEMIRLAAYELYIARGGVDGHALEDWLAAEAQVDRTTAQEPPPAPRASSH